MLRPRQRPKGLECTQDMRTGQLCSSGGTTSRRQVQHHARALNLRPRAGSKPAPAAVRPPSGRGRPKERPRGDGVAPPSFFLLLLTLFVILCYFFSNSSGKRQAAHTRLLLAHSGDQTGLPLVSYGVSMVVCDGYHQCLVVNHLPRSSCAFVGCVAAAAPICFICFFCLPRFFAPPSNIERGRNGDGRRTT